MLKHQSCFVAFIYLACSTWTFGQGVTLTYAERLGWPKGSRVAIFHVDDAGMSHDSNQGAIEAISQGIATSTSIMMPCPWVPEMAAYAKTHPDMDVGLHLTLTAEWQLYRWGPLAGRSVVPGLVDTEGCLWRSSTQVAQSASADEVEQELRAQLDRASLLVLTPTHLDTHMGVVTLPKYIDRYIKLGIEKNIPIMLPAGHLQHIGAEIGALRALVAPAANQIWNAGLPLIDDLVTNPSRGDSFPEMKAYLMQLLKTQQPGVTQYIVHCTKPTEVFRFISNSGEKRLAELQLMTDGEIRKLIEEQGIILSTWRELKTRRQKVFSLLNR
jgi:predicted glycoside hydrolase/deacetylase ChbG (UPF0249 family)